MQGQPKPSDKGFSHAFKQQIMKAWQPVPTLNSTIALFLVLSLFFLIMGIVLISYSNEVKENSQRYDVLCKGVQYKNDCQVDIALDSKFERPVFLYYELTNYYQNHRRYVKSKSTAQLAGSDLGVSGLSDCDPVITNAQMGKTLAFDGVTQLIPNDPAIPCGLIAKSLFNDTFVILDQSKNGVPVLMNQSGIAWPSDLEGRYSNTPGDWQKKQWFDVTNGNEAFHGLDENSSVANFQEIVGQNRLGFRAWTIQIHNLKQQTTYLINQNIGYDVSQFEGQKSLVISTTNVFGGKNEFLAYSYIVVGVICAIVTIGFSIRKVLTKQEQKNR